MKITYQYSKFDPANVVCKYACRISGKGEDMFRVYDVDSKHRAIREYEVGPGILPPAIEAECNERAGSYHSKVKMLVEWEP